MIPNLREATGDGGVDHPLKDHRRFSGEWFNARVLPSITESRIVRLSEADQEQQ